MVLAETPPQIDLKRTKNHGIWNWVNRQFKEVQTHLQKADLLKSTATIALLAQLISLTQKDVPGDSKIKNLLEQHKQEGSQALLVVRFDKPWTAILEENNKEVDRVTQGIQTISILVGPKGSEKEHTAEGAYNRALIQFTPGINKDVSQIKIAEVGKSDSVDFRPATIEEVNTLALLLEEVTLERI